MTLRPITQSHFSRYIYATGTDHTAPLLHTTEGNDFRHIGERTRAPLLLLTLLVDGHIVLFVCRMMFHETVNTFG